jgi:hypothetical protein
VYRTVIGITRGAMRSALLIAIVAAIKATYLVVFLAAGRIERLIHVSRLPPDGVNSFIMSIYMDTNRLIV